MSTAEVATPNSGVQDRAEKGNVEQSAVANFDVQQLYEQASNFLQGAQSAVSESAHNILNGFAIVGDGSKNGTDRSSTPQESSIQRGAQHDRQSQSAPQESSIDRGSQHDRHQQSGSQESSIDRGSQHNRHQQNTPQESSIDRGSQHDRQKQSAPNESLRGADKNGTDKSSAEHERTHSADKNEQALKDWNKLVDEKLGDSPHGKMMKELGKALINGDSASLQNLQKMMKDMNLNSDQRDQLGEFQSDIEKQLGVDVQLSFEGNGDGTGRVSNISLGQRVGNHEFGARLNIPSDGAMTARDVFRAGFAGPIVNELSVSDALKRLQKR